MKDIPVLNEGSPQEFMHLKAVFPGEADTRGFSHCPVILKSKRTGANYMLELNGLDDKRDTGVFVSTFKPKATPSYASQERGYDINFEFTPAMMLSPDDICLLYTSPSPRDS